MMLHRSTSSRRKRTSRAIGNTSQNQSTVAGGRRASLATVPSVITSEASSDSLSNLVTMERQRMPRRGSTVPNISLDVDNNTSQDEAMNRRMLPLDPETMISRGNPSPDGNRSPRHSLIPEDYNRSPRNSLVPNDPMRSPRNSLVPDISRSRNSLIPEVTRSPRHSLVPESALSPRNSLVPSDIGYNRSPRNSLVPQSSSRTLLSDNGLNGGPINRSPRHSLVPEPLRSPRGSVANIDFDRSPRGSICPDISNISRMQSRGSVAIPIEMDRSPRGSISSECHNQSPRGSIVPDTNRSPRGSIVPDSNRSPRGSIDISRSPRGSICPDSNRSPRGSIGMSAEAERIGGGGPDPERSPRGSIDRGGGGQERRALPRTGFNPQDGRRTSVDQGTTKNRSGSPYRQKETNSGSIRSGGSGTAQVNLGYGTNAWADSRRASSSVSQISGDESRRLCVTGSADLTKKGSTSAAPLGVAAYGSLVFQLKDANLEANGTCDFICRALRVVSKTMVVTVCLACLSTMPILMLILGVQFIRDCPREPNIPIYMVVGGILGSVRMFWTLYTQIRSRRPEVLTVPGVRSHVSPTKLASILLSCFLAGWFVLGNYWILRIRMPDFAPTFYEPNLWCHKTLYIFSIVHLFVVYTVISASLLTALGLTVCRILSCPWPERYK
ncbi:uncharacterized protein LOC122498267 [Leptopilina heterotoma]|uniref:uncharacterized protein LOC122498267 n=1 Tax=Leptopilina heterotoma TaxID=63436 RepID=UPI001CAA366F|nr:uncharacterized protein LOC122498267 [Leptopilina heterotoma]